MCVICEPLNVYERYLQAVVDVAVWLFFIVLGLPHRASVSLKNILCSTEVCDTPLEHHICSLMAAV